MLLTTTTSGVYLKFLDKTTTTLSLAPVHLGRGLVVVGKRGRNPVWGTQSIPAPQDTFVTYARGL
jgi:hypothetical protein